MNASGDSTDLNEGTSAIFTANNDKNVLRRDWPIGAQSAADVRADPVRRLALFESERDDGRHGQCCSSPVASTTTAWFKIADPAGYVDKNRGPIAAAGVPNARADQIRALARRCMGDAARGATWPGDPHLVAVERVGATPIRRRPRLRCSNGYPEGRERHDLYTGRRERHVAHRRYAEYARSRRGIANAPARGPMGDAKYLFPIDRGFNTNAKGVISRQRQRGRQRHAERTHHAVRQRHHRAARRPPLRERPGQGRMPRHSRAHRGQGHRHRRQRVQHAADIDGSGTPTRTTRSTTRRTSTSTAS